MERLELHLTYHCPERCLFCSEDHRMEAYKAFPVTWGRIATILREHARRGIKAVHLTGGEPTIHPRFVEVLVLAKKLGMRTSVGTIGTMLCRPDFAHAALPHLDEALFSVHGPDAATHDAIAGRVGSFERVTTAIRLARDLKPGFGLFANTVLCQANIAHIADTVSMLQDLGVRLVVVSNTTPEGAAWDRYDSLAVPFRLLQHHLAHVPPRIRSTQVRFFGVPMCLLGPWASWSNDLHWDPRVTVEWQSAPGSVHFTGIYSWAPDRRRLHVDACATCARRELCPGVYDRAATTDDLSALQPFLAGTSPAG